MMARYKKNKLKIQQNIDDAILLVAGLIAVAVWWLS